MAHNGRGLGIDPSIKFNINWRSLKYIRELERKVNKYISSLPLKNITIEEFVLYIKKNLNLNVNIEYEDISRIWSNDFFDTPVSERSIKDICFIYPLDIETNILTKNGYFYECKTPVDRDYEPSKFLKLNKDERVLEISDDPALASFIVLKNYKSGYNYGIDLFSYVSDIPFIKHDGYKAKDDLFNSYGIMDDRYVEILLVIRRYFSFQDYLKPEMDGIAITDNNMVKFHDIKVVPVLDAKAIYRLYTVILAAYYRNNSHLLLRKVKEIAEREPEKINSIPPFYGRYVWVEPDKSIYKSYVNHNPYTMEHWVLKLLKKRRDISVLMRGIEQSCKAGMFKISDIAKTDEDIAISNFLFSKKIFIYRANGNNNPQRIKVNIEYPGYSKIYKLYILNGFLKNNMDNFEKNYYVPSELWYLKQRFAEDYSSNIIERRSNSNDNLWDGYTDELWRLQ